MENKGETGSTTQSETERLIDNGENELETEHWQYDVAPLSENSNSVSHVTEGDQSDVGISKNVSQKLYSNSTLKEANKTMWGQIHNEATLETPDGGIRKSKRIRLLGNKVKYARTNDYYSGEDMESLEDHDTPDTSDEEWHCGQDSDDDEEEEMPSTKKNSSKFSNEMVKDLTQKLKNFVQTINLGNKPTSNKITHDNVQNLEVGLPNERGRQIPSSLNALPNSQTEPVKQNYSDTAHKNTTVINEMSKSKNDHLICKVCHHVFASARWLGMHIRKKHLPTLLKESRMNCSICGKSFNARRRLYEHQWKKHIQPDQEFHHKCNICGKIYSYQDSLVQHQKVHIGSFRKHCDICKETTESLISHKIFFHSVVFLSRCCRVCKGKYSKLCSLSPEEKVAIAEASLSDPCYICGRTMNTKNPKKDQLEKSDAQEFKYCSECCVGFDTKFQLKQHKLSFFHKLKQQDFRQEVYSCHGRNSTEIEEIKDHVSHEHNGMNYQNQPEDHSDIKTSHNDSSKTKNVCVKQKGFVDNSIIQDCVVQDEIKVEPGNSEDKQTSIVVKSETEVEGLLAQRAVDKMCSNSEIIPVKQEVVMNLKKETDVKYEFIKREHKSHQTINRKLDSFKFKTLKITLTDFRSKGLRSANEHLKDENEGSANDTTLTKKQTKDPPVEDINVEALPTKAICPLCKIDLPQFMPIGNHLEEHNFIQMCVFCNTFIPDGENVLQHIADHHRTIPYQKKLGCAVCARGVINHKEKPENVYLQIVKCNNGNRQKRVGVYVKQSVSKCSKCNIEIHKWEDFHNHLSDCDLKFNRLKEKSCICNYCGKYTNEEAYNNSAYEISYFRKPEDYRPLECKPMQCPVCMQKCKSAYEVFVHCLFHVSPPYYSCHVCTKTFKFWTYMVDHCTEHGTLCRYCNRKFNSSKETLEHIKHNHGETMTYVCNVCYFGTSDHKEFERHMDSHSSGQTEMFKCKFCYLVVPDLVSHYEGCALCVKCCGKWYSTKSFHAHAKLHKPKQTCPICKDNQLFNELSLKQHIRHFHSKNEKGKTHLCEYCAKPFISKAALALHVNSQHLKKRSFTCQTCGKSFLYEQSLVLHIRTHTKERPFRCDTCGKAFASMSNLKDHIRIHTGEKPYVCSVCKKAFTKSCNMKKHIKLMHPQITFTSSCPPKV